MKLLLHICCAPCLIYPLEVLRNKGFQIEGYFANSNIHPLAEYKKRREALENFNKDIGINIVYPQYDSEKYFMRIGNNQQKPKRCEICWRMRLEKTADFAKENGFDSFSTTLLVSPYQDIDLIKDIGQDIAKEKNIEFYFEDFRPGFHQAHNQAKAKGVYCQKYCGCIYSERERYESDKLAR